MVRVLNDPKVREVQRRAINQTGVGPTRLKGPACKKVRAAEKGKD